MKRRRFLRFAGSVPVCAAAFVLFASAPVWAHTPASQTANPRLAEPVFVVSFDGGKPAVMQQSRMPTVFSLMKDGAGTCGAGGKPVVSAFENPGPVLAASPVAAPAPAPKVIAVE